MSCDQGEFDSSEAFRFQIRLSAAKVNRLWPSTILRWTLYLHVLAILVCVGLILQELNDRHTTAARPRAGPSGEFIIVPALLGLVACPFATMLICSVYSKILTRRAKAMALTTMAVLICFQVVWIIGPCVGSARDAKEIMRDMEMRMKQPETSPPD